MEFANKKQIESLLRLQNFYDLKVQMSLHDSRSSCNSVVRCPDLKGWLVDCFEFNDPLRQYFSLYRVVSQREGERGEKGQRVKNVQTTPTRTYCKRNRPLPYYHPNCRTPRHWKFTQNHRTTRPPPIFSVKGVSEQDISEAR